MTIDSSNTAQWEAWDGDQGASWAANLARLERCAARYHDHLLAAAAIAPAEHVLDIGCGGGRTTRDAARRGASALGVDLSSRLLELARAQAAAEHLANVAFVQADAQVHAFPAARFDVAISKHGAMFFGDPVAAFANIGRALRDGGRLALITWQPLADNEFVSAFRAILGGGRDLPVPQADAPSPFSLSRPDRVEKILRAAGFTDIAMTALAEPLWFGADAEEAFDFITEHYGGFAADLGPDARARAFAALRADVAAHLGADGVRYGSAAWLVTARR